MKVANYFRVELIILSICLFTVIVKSDEVTENFAIDYRADVFSSEIPYESKYIEIHGSKMH
jgi:hypothetical protein